MAQNVEINGVVYQNVPHVDIPLALIDDEYASFYDISDSTATSEQILSGYSAYSSSGVKQNGAIPTKTATNITVSGASVTVPSGYYALQTVKSVGNGSVTAPATISGTSATVSSDTNTITLSKTISVTPNVTTAGYISSGTAGNSSVSLTANVTTKGATTYTPTTTDQTIASGTYLTGAQTISGDVNLVGTNIKSGVSIFGVPGSLSSATVSQDPSTKVLTIS